ncbi:hypothetical protein A0H81_10828 [Grifola frondosa]|uniref:Uncharacterized protein n=1 Tax=Grifola frondosa TaxID=5627 RepID=A0A1C7LXM1_GRIFR|nr:hypothetical protein A0H81_10828 [Grifola frondosa]
MKTPLIPFNRVILLPIMYIPIICSKRVHLIHNEHEYHNLCNSFKKLHMRLPHIYEEIAIFLQVLSGRQASPVHFFSGFVLNLNVVTQEHQNTQDL